MQKLFIIVSLALATLSAATPAQEINSRATAATGLNANFVAKGKKFWGTAADSGTLNIACKT